MGGAPDWKYAWIDPHAHDWDWTKKPERQPPRAIRPNEKPPQE
jgi:hypothetical protein